MRPWTGPLLVLALLTALLTYPMAGRAGSVGPINTGDGQWSIWSTCWVARTLVENPLRLYDANIFSPYRGTLAYSETNLAGGVLAMPAWWATRNPYLAYNTAILLAFFLSSFAAFALARRLMIAVSGVAEGSSPVAQGSSLAGSLAALLGAIGFAFAPLIIVRLAHVQLLMTFGVPLSLLALHRFVERQSVLRGALLAAALAVAGLSSGYYGIAAGIAVGLGLVYYGVSRGLWRQPRYLIACVSVVVAAGLLVLPFFLPYLTLEAGGGAFRSIDETRRYSADWRSYLTSTSHVQRWFLGWVVPFDRTAFPERVLFPGFTISALAAIALASRAAPSRRGIPLCPAGRENAGAQPEADGPRRAVRVQMNADGRDAVGFYALLAFVGAWLSFGPAAGLYWLGYTFVPAFSLTRAPARLGILVVLSLAMLASIGLAMLLTWQDRRRAARGHAERRSLVAVAGLACTLVVAEVAAVPLDLRPALPIPSAHRSLGTLPAGAVAEFPYFYLERDLYRNSLYMLYSTAHWHPLVNGYSDFMPADYRQTVVAISTFPSREAFRLLRERDARYAIFHLNLYDRRSREKLMDAIARYRDFLRPLAGEGDVWLYEIAAWPQ